MPDSDNTGFLLNLLQTQSHFKWLLEFFSYSRNGVAQGWFDEDRVFEQFKEKVLEAKPTTFLGAPIGQETVDWPRLYKECKDLTRPMAWEKESLRSELKRRGVDPNSFGWDLALDKGEKRPAAKRDPIAREGEPPAQSEARALPRKKLPLSLDDVEHLLDSWGQSYSYVPPQVKEEIAEVVSQIAKGYFADIMGQFLKHRLASDKDIMATSSRAVSLAYQWGFICFAIGVEGSLDNINNDDVPYYLSACSLPFNIYLVGFLDALEAKNKLRPNRADKIVSELGSFLTKSSVFLANQGFIYHQSLKPKYVERQESPLAAELLDIDIGELRKGKSDSGR